MAGKSERVKVEVRDSTEGDVRTFNITLTAPASDFLLTDLLKQRGVIEALDADLKQAVKGATESYVSAAESLIAKLAKEPKQARKSRTNGTKNGKDERSSSMALSEQPRRVSSGATASTVTTSFELSTAMKSQRKTPLCSPSRFRRESVEG
jgi:hypothetical protein